MRESADFHLLSGRQLVLREIAAAHGEGVSLADRTLDEVDLSGLNLNGADLTGTELNGARLEGTQLVGAIMHRTSLVNANLQGANLSGADLEDARLSGADLTGTNLTNAALIGTRVGEARLGDAVLAGVLTEGVRGRPASLPTGWIVTKGRLIGPTANLSMAELSGADLRSADLSSAHLDSADLRGARLEGVKLDDASLIDAQLNNAQLEGAWLMGARLDGANLTNAQLMRAHLNGASLLGANLSYADLTSAVIVNVDARGITGTPKGLPYGWVMVSGKMVCLVGDSGVLDLRGVDLHDVAPSDLLIPSDLSMVRYDQYTVWPDWYTGAKSEPPRAPQTDAFRKWFGKSMVVDANGNPMVVYHGTTRGGFTAFDISKVDAHHNGFFFTDSYRLAGTYATLEHEQDPTPPIGRSRGDGDVSIGVIPVYLRLQDPLIVDAKGASWAALPFKAAGGASSGIVDKRAKVTTDDVAFYAKANGYDGAIILNVHDSSHEEIWDEPGNVYIAFRPNQIKHATLNVGTYSLRTPDMRKNPRRKTSRKSNRRKTSRSR